jgi:hypothetical protein
MNNAVVGGVLVVGEGTVDSVGTGDGTDDATGVENIAGMTIGDGDISNFGAAVIIGDNVCINDVGFGSFNTVDAELSHPPNIVATKNPENRIVVLFLIAKPSLFQVL